MREWKATARITHDGTTEVLNVDLYVRGDDGEWRAVKLTDENLPSCLEVLHRLKNYPL